MSAFCLHCFYFAQRVKQHTSISTHLPLPVHQHVGAFRFPSSLRFTVLSLLILRECVWTWSLWLVSSWLKKQFTWKNIAAESAHFPLDMTTRASGRPECPLDTKPSDAHRPGSKFCMFSRTGPPQPLWDFFFLSAHEMHWISRVLKLSSQVGFFRLRVVRADDVHQRETRQEEEEEETSHGVSHGLFARGLALHNLSNQRDNEPCSRLLCLQVELTHWRLRDGWLCSIERSRWSHTWRDTKDCSQRNYCSTCER